MALFEASVIKSHIAFGDEAEVDNAYQKYILNTRLQKNIKRAKEEQCEAAFLNELFVNNIEYRLFPIHHFLTVINK